MLILVEMCRSYTELRLLKEGRTSEIPFVMYTLREKQNANLKFSILIKKLSGTLLLETLARNIRPHSAWYLLEFPMINRF